MTTTQFSTFSKCKILPLTNNPQKYRSRNKRNTEGADQTVFINARNGNGGGVKLNRRWKCEMLILKLTYYYK